jgi:hypothetical protein
VPELDDIPSNFDVNDWLTIISVPTQTASCTTGHGEGKLRFRCNSSHLSYNDPILYPEFEGRAHLHHFFGNTGTDHHSTYQTLRTTGSGSCVGGPLNRTAYWFPAMIKQASDTFPVAKVVKPAWIEMYYQSTTNQTAGFTTTDPNPFFAHPQYPMQGFPNGYKMIFGWKHDDHHTPFGVWGREDLANADLTDTGLAQNGQGTLELLLENRPGTGSPIATAPGIGAVWDNISARIDSPPCWNGSYDYGADGRSHVAYQTGASGQSGAPPCCPATHPYVVPVLTVIVSWSNEGPDDWSTWALSSDLVEFGANHGHDYPAGTTFHTDWFGAWDTTISDIWEQEHLRIPPGDQIEANWISSSSGILCRDQKQLSSTGIFDPNVVSNGLGGFYLPEANRYADIPTNPRTRVNRLATFRR